MNEYQIDIPADADNVVRFDVEVDDAIVVHEDAEKRNVGATLYFLRISWHQCRLPT